MCGCRRLRRRLRRAQRYVCTNNENRTLSYDARDRIIGATALNIYGQEIAEYDVLDNVRRVVRGVFVTMVVRFFLPLTGWSGSVPRPAFPG